MNAKKIVAALALLAGLAPAAARAQSSIVSQIAGDEAATEKLHFSLNFGLNCATLAGAGAERLGGPSVGLAATVRLNGRLSLVPEVTLLSRKGVTAIPFFTTGDPELDPYFADPAKSALVLDYVDIPVQIRYRLGRFNVGGGPFVAFLSKATERFRAEPETGGELLYTADVTGEFRKTDYGLVLEASWAITRPRRGAGLIFHVRWQAGLPDLLRDTGSHLAVLSPTLRNRVLQIYLSFPFVR